MAITITPLGTQAYKAASSLGWIATGNVTQGDVFLIITSADDDVGSYAKIDYNGAQDNAVADVTAANGAYVTTKIWRVVATRTQASSGGYPALAAGGTNSISRTITCYKISGLAASPVDQTATGTGNSASPATSSVTTTQADEIAVGAVGTEGPQGDAAGTWSGSFTDGQRVGTTGGTDATNSTVSDGYRSLSSTGSVSAAKSSITSRRWAAALVTYKAAAGGPFSVTVPAGSMSVTGRVPVAVLPRTVPIPLRAMELTGQAPTALTPRNVPVPVASVGLTGRTPSAMVPFAATVPVGAVELTGRTPAVMISLTVAVPAGAVVMDGKVPRAMVPFAATVPGRAVVLIGYAPSLGQSVAVLVPAGAVTVAGKIPVALAPRLVPVPKGNLAVAGAVPVVVTPRVVAVPAGELAADGYAPLVVIGAGAGAEIPAAVLVLAGRTPVAAVTLNALVRPGVGAVVIAGKVPYAGSSGAPRWHRSVEYFHDLAPATVYPGDEIER